MNFKALLSKITGFLETLLVPARVLVGGVFFYSGLSKLIQPSEYFELAISFYRIIPDRLLHPIALVLPWIELISGTFLILGYCLIPTAVVLSILTGIFQLMLGQAIVRRVPIDECGCFGGGLVHLTLYQSFVMDTVMLLTLIQVATSEKPRFTLDNLLNN